MQLQTTLVNKINHHYGLEGLKQQLYYSSKSVSLLDNSHIQNTLKVLDLLFETTLDLERLALLYKTNILHAIELLQEIFTTTSNQAVKFIIELYQDALHYIDNIRLLG